MQLHSGSEGKGVCTQLIMELRAGKGLSFTTRGAPWSFSTVPMSSEGALPRGCAWICGEVAIVPGGQFCGLRLGCLVDRPIAGQVLSAQGLG